MVAYRLTGVTLETDASEESMEALSEVWQDILSGRIPLMHDRDGNFAEGLSPVTEFCNMAIDGSRAYPVNIRTVEAGFFADLQEKAENGQYRVYSGSHETDIGPAADAAWGAVMEDVSAGILDGSKLSGYESTVPADYTPDHTARCFLYIRSND